MNKIYIVQEGVIQKDMYASHVKTKDIRLQGHNVEKILVDYFKRLGELDDLTSSLSKEKGQDEEYETLRSEIGNLRDEISVIEQKSDRIELLVKSISGESEITITDKLIEAISKEIKVTAENIDLNGYVSNRKVKDENGNEVIIKGNWHIADDGTAGFEDLVVEGEVSCERIVVNEISSPNYPKTLSGDIDLYIDPVKGDDDIELEDEATFRTINQVLKLLPKNLNGHKVTITLKGDITENIYFDYYHTGRILLFLNGFTVNGFLMTYLCSAEMLFYGGATESSNVYGKIAPVALKRLHNSTWDTSVCIQKSPFCRMHYIDVYGSKTNASSYGIITHEYSNFRIENVRFYDCYNACLASMLSEMYAQNTSGKASKYGWSAIKASTIFLDKGTQVGGSTNEYTASCGEIKKAESVPFDGNDPGNKNPNNPGNDNDEKIPTIKTVTYTSTYGDTYRSTVYNNWKKDGTVRQGDYGYGDCNGVWFFGSQFTNLKGKDITKVVIEVTRQAGGYGSTSIPLKLKMHNHSSRPSGAPKYLDWSVSLSLVAGKTGTITITNEKVLNAIKNGTMKGFGLQSTYNKSNYAVCSGTCKVTVTYKE